MLNVLLNLGYEDEEGSLYSFLKGRDLVDGRITSYTSLYTDEQKDWRVINRDNLKKGVVTLAALSLGKKRKPLYDDEYIYDYFDKNLVKVESDKYPDKIFYRIGWEDEPAIEKLVKNIIRHSFSK